MHTDTDIHMHTYKYIIDTEGEAGAAMTECNTEPL
jgi:hypothetical protein